MEPAIRLTISYFGDRPLELVEARRFSKRIAGTHGPLLDVSRRSGFLIELRDGSGRPIYQRAMDDPTRRYEGPSGKEGSLTTSGTPRAGIFSVVVPDLANADRLIVYASRPYDAPAAPIADFNVRRP